MLAGIGNAYSDEILHVATVVAVPPGWEPRPDEVKVLYDAMRETLGDAVQRARGLSAAELKAEKKQGMRVHGRAGLPCPECGDTILQVSFADSSLDYCPTCQTGGKPLADRRLSKLLR